MKKTKFIFAVFVVLMVMITNAYAAKNTKALAYVDLSRLFNEYHKTKEYDKFLEGKHADLTDIIKSKIEEIKEAEGKLAILNEDKKGELENNIQEMKGSLAKFDEQEKINLTKERNEKIREILLEIEKIVSDYAEKNDYPVILNDRVLIYGNPSFDLTEKILKVLNK